MGLLLLFLFDNNTYIIYNRYYSIDYDKDIVFVLFLIKVFRLQWNTVLF